MYYVHNLFPQKIAFTRSKVHFIIKHFGLKFNSCMRMRIVASSLLIVNCNKRKKI